MTENFEPSTEGPIKVGGDYDPAAPQPGAPTEEELAADTNLYPQATDDDVPDGSQLPDSDDLPEESTEGAEDV